MGILKQGLRCDFDRLREIMNRHADVQAFQGHNVWFAPCRYELRTIRDNMALLTPGLLGKAGDLFTASGMRFWEKLGAPLAGRGPGLSEGVLETGWQSGGLAGSAEARGLPRVGSGRYRPARRPCMPLRGPDRTPRAPGKDDSARGAGNSASPLVPCQTVEASNSGDTRDFGINLARYQETHLNVEALFSSGKRAEARHKLCNRSKRPAQHSAQNDNANDRDGYLPSQIVLALLRKFRKTVRHIVIVLRHISLQSVQRAFIFFLMRVHAFLPSRHPLGALQQGLVVHCIP